MSFVKTHVVYLEENTNSVVLSHVLDERANVTLEGNDLVFLKSTLRKHVLDWLELSEHLAVLQGNSLLVIILGFQKGRQNVFVMVQESCSAITEELYGLGRNTTPRAFLVNELLDFQPVSIVGKPRLGLVFWRF